MFSEDVWIEGLIMLTRNDNIHTIAITWLKINSTTVTSRRNNLTKPQKKKTPLHKIRAVYRFKPCIPHSSPNNNIRPILKKPPKPTTLITMARGPREPPTRATQVSKKLAWLLRHGAEEEGLQFLEGGYLDLSDVLSNRKFKSMKVTFPEIREVVAADEKQRYTMQPKPDADATSDKPADFIIRANQGHSVKMESEGLLTPVTKENMPAAAVHGTTHAAWGLIVASGGLKPMARNHVHFASGLPAGFTSVVEQDDEKTEAAAAPVISGMRKTSTILVFLDLAKAMDAGLEFGLSDNGVVLTAGNQEGLVPLELFQRVEDRTGLGVLVENGKIVKEAPESWSKGKGRA
jgi:2'-phosphotransferase